MGPEGALSLLGPQSKNPLVRKYAVTVIKEQADDAQLEMYLLHLVQVKIARF